MVEHNSRMIRRLTDDPSDEFNASFSRDGRRLYFTSNRTGRWEIWSMPVEGGLAEQVTRNGGFYAQEDFQRKFLYFARTSDSSFWRRSLEDGSEERPGNMHPYDWAAWDLTDRGGFLVLRSPHRIAFASLPVIEGEFIQVEKPRNMQPYVGRNISLTPDGRHLFYSEIETSDDEVMLVDF